MYFTNPNPLDEGPLVTELQNTVGQLVMFVQVINAVFATGMLFGEPLNGLMDAFVSHLDPDKVFSNAHCLNNAIKEPVTQYGLVISAPVMFMAVLFLAYLVGKYLFNGTFLLDGFFNIIGEVLVEFYISITLAIFSPFDCYGHPNGLSSVQKYPKVICGESDHGGMVGLSIFGILAYPMAAIAVTIFMTWYYPRAMMKDDVSTLVRGRFLFDRWRPECYWFCNVTIVRNFLIAFFPCVIAEDQLDVTVILMMIALVIALVLLVWFKPRRTPNQNHLDCFISIVQIVTLSFGVTSVHGEVLRQSLSLGCVLLIASVVFAVCGLIAVRAFQLVTNKSFSVYLCHHSGAGGSACRVLHTILLKLVNGNIFYDIDNLGFICLMLDAVKLSKNVLVIFGSETFCRPWCIGAIVCAQRNKTPMHTVMLADPIEQETVCGSKGSEDGYQKNFSCRGSGKSKQMAFEVDTCSLRGHGVVQEEVHPAIASLTKVEPILLNFHSESSVNAKLGSLCGQMSIQSLISVERATAGFFVSTKYLVQYRATSSGKITPEALRQAVIQLILCDHADGEAVAVSRLFQSVVSKASKALSTKQVWLEDQDIASPDYATIVGSGKAEVAIFMFTQNTCKSATQLARMGLLYKLKPAVHMLPVVSGTAFDFPDEDYMFNLSLGKVLHLGTNPEQRLAALAGDEVSLKNISAGMVHVMAYLVAFVNVPQLKESELDKALLGLLTRAGGGGRRSSSQQQPQTISENVTGNEESKAPVQDISGTENVKSKEVEVIDGINDELSEI